ncbi:MAG: tRNA1(Val) (adenine(37)-N6)-methyltransferase [Lawsonibacter sp.]|jgi:tRNA1Val (adenine37-N6)-methyltransferase
MAGNERLGPYTLSWPDGVFPLGEDALALGEFVTLRPGWSVCDLGTGSGVLLLLLAARQSGLSLHGVELNPLAAQTAQKNLEANGLDGHICTGDLRTFPLPRRPFDLVVSNPPYFPMESGSSGGPQRSEENCSLEQLCSRAGQLVRNGGRFALCHRPERMVDVLYTLRFHNLEPKRLKLVSHSLGHPPSLLLVEGIKQGHPGLKVVVDVRHP